ncbi:MAG: fatty acid desaturase [Acidobacteriota bacterium]|nr:fatty acid desaturase [Acidobacteriota bacterium]
MSAVAHPQVFAARELKTLDQEARRLVKDLHAPRPAIYWTDLLLTSATGWTAFAIAIIARPFSGQMFAAMAIAALAFYRGLCFLHEVSHLRQSALRGFETVWNALLGIPLLMPSFIYVGVHQNHHKLTTYGTLQDPEYLPFAGRKPMIVVFALESFLLPLAFAIRFLALSPAGLLSPRFHRWLAVRASSLCMNLAYRRDVSEADERRMKHWESALLIVWVAAIALAARGVMPWRVLTVWFAVTSLASFINTLRTLGAHHYESDGEPLDRNEQLFDSIDTPGAWWTEIWAPVGLRYHALHHYFPGIPYHNLGSAYQRLALAMPTGQAYRQASSPSLWASLRSLYRGESSTRS